MKKMDISPTCLTCMVSQVEKAIRLLRPDWADNEIVKAQKKIMARLSQLEESYAPYYGQAVYQGIAEILNEKDPYKRLKKKYNKISQELIPALKHYLKKANDPILAGLTIAILGNTIDFGTPHKINLKEEVNQLSLKSLKINDYEEFKKDFTQAKSILIIGDNAGEIVFDKIMIENFMEHFPEKEFVYAVRGGPAINDATIEDAEEIGLAQLVKVEQTSASPGVILKQATDSFRKTFHTADIILSKGQGNFESLDRIKPEKGIIYFLLKAKCDYVADLFGVKKGDLILRRQTNLYQNRE